MGARVVGEYARGSRTGLALSEGRESAIAIGEDVAFGGGDADVSDLGRLVAGVSEVDGPENVHLGSHDGIRMLIAIS